MSPIYTGRVSGGAGVSDHGALTGLSDDDHTAYTTTADHAAIDHTGLTGVGVALAHATSAAAGANQTLAQTFTALFSAQFSLSVPAVVGDRIVLTLMLTNTNSGGQRLWVDFVVNGTRIGDSTNGVWANHTISGFNHVGHTIVVARTAVSGDLSGGNFAVVPHVRNEVNNTMAIYYTAPAARFLVQNFGQ